MLAPLELQALDGKKAPTTGFAAKSLLNAALTTGVKAVGGRGGVHVRERRRAAAGRDARPVDRARSPGPATRAGRSPRRSRSPTRRARRSRSRSGSRSCRCSTSSSGKTLPTGRVDRFYSAKLPVKGKDSTKAFFALAGKIPPGLEYNELTRRLEGTLLKAGTYRLRVYAFSANGAPISKLFTIKVRP